MTASLWIVLLAALLAFYVAWSLGANDVANSMGTVVGARVLTLTQALVVAGVLEFAGTVLFSQDVAGRLATAIADPINFADTPQTLLLGMLAVLFACGVWLQLATRWGMPVSSSHAVVGAIAGFSWVALGRSGVNWDSLTQIAVAWVITPFVSGGVAALLYATVRRWLLDRPDPLLQWREWAPWLSALLFGIFGSIVFPKLATTPAIASLPLPAQDVGLMGGAIAATLLTWRSWRQLAALSAQETPVVGSVSVEPAAVEKLFGQFQILSACFVAFAHGANDVGNAIAPFAVVRYLLDTGTVPLGDFPLPLWMLVFGGAAIVAGLAFQGKTVIATVGEGITALQPSSGFCAELATATTVLLASRWGFPVSTSHALVGAVVAIGLLRVGQSVRFQTIRSVILAWAVTLPVTALLGAGGFLTLGAIGDFLLKGG